MIIFLFFNILLAASGEEALDLLKDECVDYGIIDMRLPGIDGNELIIKAHELCPDMNLFVQAIYLVT